MPFTITFSDVALYRGPPFIRAFIAMCASGDLLSSCATGVGNNPDPVSSVRGAQAAEAGMQFHSASYPISASLRERAKPSTKQTLKRSPRLTIGVERELANESSEFRGRALRAPPDLLPYRHTDVLTGHPPQMAYSIVVAEWDRGELTESTYQWTVGQCLARTARQNGSISQNATVWNPGSLESKTKSADAGEEVKYAQHRSCADR